MRFLAMLTELSMRIPQTWIGNALPHCKTPGAAERAPRRRNYPHVFAPPCDLCGILAPRCALPTPQRAIKKPTATRMLAPYRPDAPFRSKLVLPTLSWRGCVPAVLQISSWSCLLLI
jgi:hypothetical protein